MFPAPSDRLASTNSRSRSESVYPRTMRAMYGHVKAEITRVTKTAEGTDLEVTIRIDPSWHVNGHRPLSDALVPTRIEGDGGAAFEVHYPSAKEVVLGFAGGPVAVYEGTVTLGVRAAGGGAVTLSLQACSDRVCLLPESVRLFR